MEHNLSRPFKIACAIENTSCYERIEKGIRKRYVVGRASGTKVDHDHERVAESAIKSLQRAIEEGIVLPDGTWSQVPLQSEHQHGWDDTLGFLTKAWVDEDQGDLWIEAEIDEDNPRGTHLYNRLTKQDEHGRPRKQLGLSIGGLVLEAGYEWDEDLNKSIRVFYDIGLNEVSVTSRPAYPTAFLQALNKSVTWDGVDAGRHVVVTEEIMKSYRKPSEEQVEEAADVTKSEEVEETVAEDITEKNITTDSDVSEEAVEKAEDVAEVEDEAAEVAEKSEAEEVEAAEVEKATTSVRINFETWADAWDADPMGALKDAVQSLIDEVEGMKGVLKSFEDAAGDVEDVEKSQDEATEVEAVEKTASDESAEVEKTTAPSMDADVITKALTDTLGTMLDEKLGPVATALTDMEKRLSEVEAQEVDGSISVSKAINDGDDESPEVLLEKHLEGLSPTERIATLLRMQQSK